MFTGCDVTCGSEAPGGVFVANQGLWDRSGECEDPLAFGEVDKTCGALRGIIQVVLSVFVLRLDCLALSLFYTITLLAWRGSRSNNVDKSQITP